MNQMPKSRSWLTRLTTSANYDPQDKSDIRELLHQAQTNNIVNDDAVHMIEGVLAVSDLQVREVMIPRSQIVIIENDWDFKKTLDVIIDSGHSRFPVVDSHDHSILGLLLAKDLLKYAEDNTSDNFDLQHLLRDIAFIPESKRLNTLLKEFRINHSHIAMVVDEYGNTAGLVTIEDVIEQIVGDIEDEHDSPEETAHIQAIDDHQYWINPLLSVNDFNQYFHTDFDTHQYDTIGGIVLNQLGHFPEKGEQTQLDNFHFTVERCDKRRLHLLKLRVLSLNND